MSELPLRRPLTVILCSGLMAGCFPSTPGVEGVHGTSPAPGAFWTPPANNDTTKTETPPPNVPPDLAARVNNLELSDVLDVALRNNTATSASWYTARAAAENYGSAKGAYYPTIALNGTFNAVKTVPSIDSSRGSIEEKYYGPTLTLSWLLLDFGGRSGAIGEAREGLLAADWTHNATVQTVVLTVEQAYFQYLGTKALLAAQQTTLQEAQTNLQAAEQRHNVGLATIADVLQARTVVSQALLAVQSTTGQLATTRGALALSMGLPANVPYDVSVPTDTTIPAGITDSVDTLIDRAVRERPDLQAARANARAAQARISQARSLALPSLELGGNAGQTFYTIPVSGSAYTATLTLHIPLFAGWSDIYGTKAASATANAARAQTSGLEQEVVYQVFSSYYGLKTATQQVQTSADLVASAQQSAEVALGRYRAGAGALVDLLVAQAALASARAQRIQARFSWYVALAQLAHDVGVLDLHGSSSLHLSADSAKGSPQ